jgi:predicted nucleic acid-binding protein
MRFADIPHATDVFLDANTFVYHFIADPNFGASCTKFLKRIESHEIVGWTSPHVLAEVSHRLMTIEACSLFGWTYQGIAARLRRHP